MKEATSKPKPKRVDGQITGLAGELFVAAELLLKRGLLVSVTFGNAKAIDLFAHNPETGRDFTIQVNALRSPNFFLLSYEKVVRNVYVFVLLNKLDKAVEYFIVPGATLLDQPDRFTKWFMDPKMPGIHSKTLAQEGFASTWDVFFEKAT